MSRLVLGVLALVVGLWLAGCGRGGDGESEATSTAPETTELVVYFLLNGKVWPVRRVVGYTELVERAALNELIAGPTDQELDDFPLSNEPFQFTHPIANVPRTSEVDLQGLVVEGGIARVEVPHGLREDGVAQIVYTLTQFPAITSVDIVQSGTRRLRRADFDMFTPAILVESPLAYQSGASPLRVSGTANTFEATFAYELKDGTGRVLAEDFATATSGTGTRGTFELTVPFEVAEAGEGTLVVFERSPKDGSRVNEVAIPLHLTP